MRMSLLVRLVLTLVATGLLPLTISLYQLRVNKDALHDQLRTTHNLAAFTTAARVAAYLEPLRTAARTVRETALHQGAQSQAMQETLYGLFQNYPKLATVEIFNGAGDSVLSARGPSAQEEIDVVHDAQAPPLSFLKGSTKSWLRLVEPLPQPGEQVVVLADAADLEPTVLAVELGDEAEIVLARTDGTVLIGGAYTDLSAFPSQARMLALSGKMQSGSNIYEGHETDEDVAVAFARIEATSWVVLSRQPAHKAELAHGKILQAAWFAVLGSLALTAALSSIAFHTVIRPLRRLIHAQRTLVGADLGQGSEIEQLEAAFELLEQRVRGQEDLGRISLGRYEVVEVLGEGAMGTVFKGWDPKLERPLAIKTIRLDSEEFKRQKLVETLLREARTSAGFSHPNIVTVYDAADEGQAAFIAMELIDGISLEELVETQGRLDWRQAVCVGAAVARGLAAAHDHQLIHQDIKPANILLGRDDSIKVTDFGISQALTSASRSDGVICGTPGYIAPECLEGAGFSARSDLFALGVLLYECLSGTHPFGGKTLRVTVLNTLNQSPAPLENEPGRPSELEELVLRLLEKNPERRPTDAESVARQLEQIAVEHGLRWAFQIRRTVDVRPTGATRPRDFSLHSTRMLDLTTRPGD